ncbi:hypothetical protein EG68_07759 [Paragonimus skrjabini miyazakii]|uniref:Beta-chimaerin n=1 Tax=Paragonimus skrjabini miyazakii TaxID=59628 RepID=A0A8S9YQW0_9TREM|nr:hypothetical protein EG68_07759 [Paragonimus skrjabini miyazakii]
MEFRIWQNKLYNLQLEAPKPYLIACHNELVTRPPQYGLEFHGPISRQETEDLLQQAPDGAYLIRESQRAADAYTLVIWFDRVARNYKLFYDAETKQHYVGENRFDSVDLLVADGLIHFYVETRGADVLLKMAEANNYERTPFYKMRYHTLSAGALQSGLQKSLKDSVDSPIEQKKTDVDAVNRSRKSRRTYVPTFGEANSALNLADFNVSKVQWRRQSADVEPFSRPMPTALPPPQSLVDWPLSPDKLSHSKSDGRNYRDCPPLAELCEFRRSSVLQPEALPEPHSNLTIPPVPPPRSSSGIGHLHRTSISETSESTVSTLVRPVDPPSTTLRKTNQFPSGHLVDGAFVKLENIPENADSPHATQTSQEFDSAVCSTLETSASSGDHSSLSGTSGSPTNASPLFVSRKQSHPIRQDRNRHAVLLTDLAETGSPTSVTVNGENRQAMLSLLERYKLPAACLVGDHSGTPTDSDRRKHNFKVQTFRGPHWCDFCTHFIWGLVAQGVKCAECGFQAHKRCSDRVPDDCLPDIKQMKRVFGVDLISLAIAERKPIPTILERCIGEVEKRGALVCEGLYRVPGNHDRVEQARAAFDKDFESAAISPSRIPDVNVITSLIKSFLRQLPVPLITYDAHPKLIDIICESLLLVYTCSLCPALIRNRA